VVHGYDGTPAEFDRLAALLAASGRPVVRVALPAQGTGDIAASARALEGDLAQRLGPADCNDLQALGAGPTTG